MLIQKWEFYTTTEPRGPRLVWGWRVLQDSAVLRQSDLYDTFLSCYRNALANGFTDHQTYLTTDVGGDTVREYRQVGEGRDLPGHPAADDSRGA